MSVVQGFYNCCGAGIHYALAVGPGNDPAVEFLRAHLGYKYGIVTFIDNEQSDAGNKIWRFLNKNDLGKCTRSRLLPSNHGGDTLRVFVWGPKRDEESLKKMKQLVDAGSPKPEPPKAAQARAW